jgi:predicted transcriptional regulator
MASVEEGARTVLVQRESMLAALVDSTLDKRELVERLDVSRSTVDRGLRELQAYGFVDRRNGGYAATVTGEAAHRAFRQFAERLRGLERMRSILRHVDPDDGLDASVLVDAEAYLEGAPPPNNVAFQLSRCSGGAERVQSVTKTISRARSARRLHEAVVTHGVTFEGVYAVDIASFLKAWGAEDRQEMAATGNYRAFVTDAETPFTVFLYHHSEHTDVCIFVYDDDDDLVGVIVTDDEAAVEWGEEYFERYRHDAIEITNEF